MQVLLTEEEYTKLKEKAYNYDFMKHSFSTLQTKLEEVTNKYHQLLAFGVSVNNEKLKGPKWAH